MLIICFPSCSPFLPPFASLFSPLVPAIRLHFFSPRCHTPSAAALIRLSTLPCLVCVLLLSVNKPSRRHSLTLPQEVSCAETEPTLDCFLPKCVVGHVCLGPLLPSPPPPPPFCSPCCFLLWALCRWLRPADRISEGFWQSSTSLQPWREHTAAMTSRPGLHCCPPRPRCSHKSATRDGRTAGAFSADGSLIQY